MKNCKECKKSKKDLLSLVIAIKGGIAYFEEEIEDLEEGTPEWIAHMQTISALELTLISFESESGISVSQLTERPLTKKELN
jgi:hypothetical protein